MQPSRFWARRCNSRKERTESPLFLKVHIHNVLGLPIKERPDVVHYSIQKPLATFHRCPCHVGRDDAVLAAKQGAVLIHRLLAHHVNRCGAKLSTVQSIGQRLFVHQRPPGGVDEHGTILHFCDGIRVDDLFGFREQGTVQGHDIGAGKQCIQIHILGDLAALLALRAVVGDDVHAEGFCQSAYRFSNAAKADNADGLSRQFRLGC